VGFPLFDLTNKEGENLPVVRVAEWKEEEVTINDIFGWLLEMNDKIFSHDSVFTLHQRFLKRICPESLLDLNAVWDFRIESAVKEYGFDVLNVPLYLFEKLEKVRGTLNTFENVENFKREQKTK